MPGDRYIIRSFNVNLMRNIADNWVENALNRQYKDRTLRSDMFHCRSSSGITDSNNLVFRNFSLVLVSLLRYRFPVSLVNELHVLHLLGHLLETVRVLQISFLVWIRLDMANPNRSKKFRASYLFLNEYSLTLSPVGWLGYVAYYNFSI